MSTTCFAVCVAALTPFGNHLFRDRVSLLLLCEQLADVDIAQIYPHSAVDQAIDHRVGLHAASEAAVPLGRGVLRAQNGRLRRIPSLDQLEQEGDVDVVHVLGEPLVQDQDLVARVLPQDLGVRPLRGGELVALHQEIRKADVAGAPAHPAGLLGKAAGEVALALAQADPDFAKLWRKVETRRSVIRSQLAMGGALPPEKQVLAACEEDGPYKRYIAACEERHGRYLKVFELFRNPNRGLERAQEETLATGAMPFGGRLP